MNQTLPNPAPRLDPLQRLYAEALRAADWFQAHRLLVCLAGGPLLTLVLVAINQFVLMDFPNSGDEYAYLYQAETMAAGRLWNQPPPSPDGTHVIAHI